MTARRRLVLSPSDIVAGHRLPAQATVGGRVSKIVRRDVWIADATGLVCARLAEAVEDVCVGDLVVVRGRLATRAKRRRLEAAELLERHRPARSDGAEAVRLRGGVGSALEKRARALAAMRADLARQRFVEVETPARTAGPALDVHIDSLTSEHEWLITSPEHHLKRLLAGGMPRIFRLGSCFRAGELGPWHEPEFTMLEWYRAFADSERVMADTERIVETVVRALTARHWVQRSGRRIDVRPPFDRMSVREAFRRYADVEDAVALAETNEPEYFQLLVDRVEPELAKRRRPVFLLRYPASQASLARMTEDDPTVADRFELYVGGVELCNGFGELTDSREQRRRFEKDRARRRELGRPALPIDEAFMGALEEGLPPCAGNALGVDRLIALALGAESIGQVMAFPRLAQLSEIADK